MNKLIAWLEEKNGDNSLRSLSRQLGLSHGYVHLVMRGERPVTWNFAAAVADAMEIDHVEAFQMAGLLESEVEQVAA